MIKFLYRINAKYDRIAEPKRFLSFMGIMVLVIVAQGIAEHFMLIWLYSSSWLFLLVVLTVRAGPLIKSRNINMSTITKLGLKEVDEAYHKAKEHLIYAEEQLKRAHIKVARLKKCSKCKHDELEDVGAHIYSQARCKDCGFTWTD